MSSSVVLITGALAGIGRSTAMAFARQGARLVVSGRRDDAGQTLATELQALGAEAEFVRAGVRKEEDVRGMIDRAVNCLADLKSHPHGKAPCSSDAVLGLQHGAE